MQPAYEPAPAYPAPGAAPVARYSIGGLVGRIVLTLLGAAGMIVGAFMNWLNGNLGTDVTTRSMWRTDFHTTTNIVATVGFVMIVLGLVAIVGLAPRSGWLTRLAGALGIAAFVLFVIELYRGPNTLPQGGAWVALAGGVVALIGGSLGTRPRVVVPAARAAVG